MKTADELQSLTDRANNMKRYDLKMAPDGYGGTDPAMIKSDHGHFTTYKQTKKIMAERDLWRWRFEELVKRLEPGPEPDLSAVNEATYWDRVKRHGRARLLHAAALEIMTQTPKGDG